MIRKCQKKDRDRDRPALVWCAYRGKKVVARGSTRRAAECHEKRLAKGAKRKGRRGASKRPGR